MNRSLRIAVADDEVEMRQYFSRMLPRMGHQVVAVAEDGRELLDLCLQTHPDMIITDIRMPHMDGMEAATRYSRRHPVPVILVSAFLDDSVVEQADGDERLEFLVKPIKLADLEATIARVDARCSATRPENSDGTSAPSDDGEPA